MKKQVALLTIGLSLILSGSAVALVEVKSPIDVETGIPAWDQEYAQTVQKLKASNTYPANGYVECRAVSKLKGSYLCLSNTQVGMNSALGRASSFIEGTGQSEGKGTVVSQDDPTYLKYKSMIGGHDLKGADLIRFHEAVEKQCQAQGPTSKFCHNPYEQDLFQNFIVPKVQSTPNFVVITFANQSSMSWRDVVTHEIMHAQYFTDAKFQQIVDAFWENEVSATDQARAVQTLSAHYDSDDELLMKNEFQAYILMSEPEYHLLGFLVPVYREKLMKQLQEAGIQPIQIR